MNNRYIGQASHSVLNRLTEHEKKKTWWTEILFFGRDDGKLDKSQLDYLEKKLIKSYTDAGFTLDNGDTGNSSFIEVFQKGRAESLWENTVQILEDSANIQLFKKNRVPTIVSTIVKPVVPSKTVESILSKEVVPASDVSGEVNRDKPKHSLTDSIGNTIEAKSLRKMYVNWVKKLAEADSYKQEFYSMLEEGSKFFYPHEHFDKRNSKWTEYLDDGLYLVTNLSAKDIFKRMDKISERLGISVEID